ncbi:YaeQ family protein [Robbsia sp. KACC 23696]|uniref:YaeQ family protein n=1 Tax=Robbsia sp. KACC 23696 TaxID=3149231 RepID=UPI00325A59DE
MALKATIHKAELVIADMDRPYYGDHALTIAKHPSENDERMMVRLIVFGLLASESLTFTKGLSDADEPDLWQKDLTGHIEKWVDIGQPDERRMTRAAARADLALVVAHGGRAADVWWQQNENKVSRLDKLEVWKLNDDVPGALIELAARSMRLSLNRQDDQLWVSSMDSDTSVLVEWTVLKAARNGQTR